MINASSSRRRPLAAVVVGLALFGAAQVARADANKRPGLDPDFPVRVEDAYPVQYQDAYLKFVSRFQENDDSTSIVQLTPEVAYGFAPDFDVHLLSTYDVGDGSRTGSGDINLNSQWLFLNETQGEWWPALAIEGDLLFPTGVGSDGLDFIVQGISTKTITWAPTWDEIHLNLTYTRNFIPNQNQNDEAYNVILGYSRRITDTTTFITDVLWEKTLTRHTQDQFAELGLIQEIGEHVKIAGGVGFSLGDDAPDYTATLAVIISK